MYIYKRGKTWTYVIEGPIINKKRNRITKGGFKTKKECEREGIAVEHKLNISNDSVYKDNKILYSDLSKQFLSYYQNMVKASTFRIASTAMISKSVEYFKNYKIKDIKILDLQNFVNYLIEKNYSPMYIKLIFNKLKQVFNYGNDIAENINYRPNFKKIILPTVNSKVRDDILTDDDIKKILKEFKNTIYYYIIQVAIQTGMRRGEILALTWDKIDFDNNIIYVDRTLTYLNTLTSPKNLSSIRRVPINSYLRLILLELKNFTKNELCFSLDNSNKIILSNKNDLDFIFRNLYGGYINHHNIQYITKNKTFHMHQFRHYFATKLINSGIPIAAVSKILGHAQISTTLKMYVGTNKNLDLTNKLDDIFGQQMDNKQKIKACK